MKDSSEVLKQSLTEMYQTRKTGIKLKSWNEFLDELNEDDVSISEPQTVSLEGMSIEELINHLYNLGVISDVQPSCEMYDFYEVVDEVKREIMRRFTK